MAFKFPVIHGINLAPGSTAQNFVFESLTADPLPAVAGRVWLNTTTKAFKYSTLDNTGAVLVKTFASAEALNADIAALQAALTDAGIATNATTDDLQAQLTSEVSRASGVEAANAIIAKDYTDAQVAALIDGAPGVLNTLKELATALENNPDVLSVIEGQIVANALAATNAISAEATRATGVETGISADLALEVTNRGTAVLNESIDRIAGDTGLDNRLTTVEGQVNGKIGDLSTLTTVDKSSLVNSVIEVNTNVSIEKSRAIAAETAEATTARAAEAAELARATAAEGVLRTDLATEVSARGTADALIRSDYNAKAFSYVSSAPAMQHTIAHGLNTASYLVNILVKGADGVFRNDTVPYEETDGNNFVVYLAFAADIRVAVKSLAAL